MSNLDSILLLTLTVVTLQGGFVDTQHTEYICRSSNAGGEIIILLNLHYGAECEQQNSRWPMSTLPAEILKWEKTLSANIDFKVIDTCSDPDIAAKVISENIPYTWTIADPSTGRANNSVCTANGSSSINIGFISEILPTGYESSKGLLGQVDVPLILTADWSTSSDISLPGVIRVGENLEIKIESLAVLMVNMDWDYVTVIYSDDVIGHNSLELFQNISRHQQICIDKSISITYNTELDISDIVTVGVVLLGSEGIGFYHLQQLTPSSHVWVTVHDLRDVDIKDGVKLYSVVEESMSQRITNSLVSFSNAVELSQNKPDCLRGNPGGCVSTPEFRQSVLEKLKEQIESNLNYTISEDGVLDSVEYPDQRPHTVWFHYNNGTIQVASLSTDEDLIANTEFVSEPSLCLLDCRAKCGHVNEDMYTYVHGKWVIVVATVIHEKADPDNQWSCRDFTTTNLFRTEAATFAFNFLKNSKLQDDRFGLLILDTCGNKLRAGGVLYDAIRGTRELCNRKGECFDPKSVVLVIGNYGSAGSQQLQTITREIPIMQMAYGASSVTLNDRETYPYFLRTNPSDDLQAHFMVELLKYFDLKSSESEIKAVNVIYTDSLYGKTGIRIVKEFLTKAGICVHLEKKVNVSATENNFVTLVDDLLAKSENVKVFIAFLDPEHISELMDTILLGNLERIWKKSGFSFLLSDTWNDDPELLRKYGDVMVGSFTFKFDSDFNSTTFRSHLRGISKSTIEKNDNYWLSTLLQEAGECKVRGNFHSVYSKKCQVSDVDLTHLEGETFANHLMKAITATMYGIRKISHDRSDSILFDPNRIQKHYDTMLSIDIPKTLEGDNLGDNIPFTPQGNGRVGYSIYNIKLDEDTQKPVYRLIKHTGYKYQDALEDFLLVPQFYKDDTPMSDIVSTGSDCINNENTTPTKVPDTSTKQEPPTGLIAAISTISGVFGLLVIGIAIALLLLYRRKIRRRGRRQSIDATSTYDQIPYGEYLSPAQRESILKFVVENPGSAPPKYLTAPNSPQSGEMAEYQIPGNNQPIRGQINRACKHGSEASGSDSYAAFTAQRAEPPTPAPRSNSAVDVNENERASGASLSVSATISTNQEQDEEDEDMF